MHQPLRDKIASYSNGRVYASVFKDGIVSLICLGSYEDVRHRYNQMVCLLGGAIQLKLATVSPSASHSRSAAPGSWFARFDGTELGGPQELFATAAMQSSDFADIVGYQTFFGDLPVGTLMHLTGYKSVAKSLSEVSNVFYGSENKPTAQVGCSADVSAAKRTRESIVVAKRHGHTIFEEQALLHFLHMLETARFLHFFHQVQPE